MEDEEEEENVQYLQMPDFLCVLTFDTEIKLKLCI